LIQIFKISNLIIWHSYPYTKSDHIMLMDEFQTYFKNGINKFGKNHKGLGAFPTYYS